MTCYHPDNESVTLAAQWLADQAQPPRPIIPALRERFNLSALEATEAAAMSDRFRMLRRVFG
ncbi:hypothetical protein ABIE78_006372 [Sinorhizobium fredii]|nr:hypothetical protein [Sinorhizobium fredii]